MSKVTRYSISSFCFSTEILKYDIVGTSGSELVFSGFMQLVESVLSKVVEEFENRIGSQIEPV